MAVTKDGLLGISTTLVFWTSLVRLDVDIRTKRVVLLTKLTRRRSHISA